MFGVLYFCKINYNSSKEITLHNTEFLSILEFSPNLKASQMIFEIKKDG
jgi:hypothetical protein